MVRERGEAPATSGVPSLSEKIKEIGFGLYQVHVFVLCAGRTSRRCRSSVVVAEAAGMQTSAALSSAIMKEFNVKGDLAQEAQMLSTYMGFALGTISSGLYFLSSYASLCIGFSSFGFFAGLGIPAAFIALAEVCPTRLRGVTNAAMSLAFCCGDLWCALGFQLLLPDLVGKHWRQVLLWIGIPPCLLLAFGLLSPVARVDTAYFLAARGQVESVKALELMASMNGKRVDLSDMAPHQEEKPVSITVALQSLTTREHSLSVLALSVMFFVKDLAFYGMGAFFPIAWRKSTLLTGLKPATELLCTAAVGLPGVVVAMLLIFSLPRRVAYSLSATACAIGAYAVRGIVDKENVLGVTGVVFYKLFYPTAQMITFLFPAEVFSTQIRVWSMSIIAFCGRMAPLAVPVLIHTFQHLFLLLTMGCFALGALLVWSLPETKDQELKTLPSESTHLKAAGSVASYGAAPAAAG